MPCQATTLKGEKGCEALNSWPSYCRVLQGGRGRGVLWGVAGEGALQVLMQEVWQGWQA